MSRYVLYTDTYGCEEYHPVADLNEGLTWAKDLLTNWMEEEMSNWRRQGDELVPTQEDVEKWNMMINGCETYVIDVDQMGDMTFNEFSTVTHTDKYDYFEGHYYYPLKEAQKLGWIELEV